MKKLYYVDSLALFPAILKYRLLQREIDADLIVDRGFFEKRGYISILENMQQKGFFKQIFYLNTFPNQKLHLTQEDYKAYIDEFYSKQLEENHINLCEYEEIIAGYDVWCAFLLLYFNIKNIRYTLLQTEPHSYHKITNPNRGWKPGVDYLALMRSYNPWSFSSECVTPILCKDAKDEIKALFPNARVWDRTNIISEMPDDINESIVKCYGLNVNNNVDKVLLLPNSYGYTRTQSFVSDKIEKKLGYFDLPIAEVLAEYQMLALDYYADECQVYIKPHPNDPISAVEIEKYYYNDISVLSEAPMDFLFTYLQKKDIVFEKMIGFFSSSIDYVDKSIISEEIILGHSFARKWMIYDSLYITAKLAEFVHRSLYSDKESTEQFTHLGVSVEVNVMEYTKESIEKIENGIICIDAIEVCRRGIQINNIVNWCRNSSIIVIVGADYTEDIFSERIEHNMSVIKVEKIEAKRRFANLRNENIYVYSDSTMNHSSIADFDVKRKMIRRSFILHGFVLNCVKTKEWLEDRKILQIKKDIEKLNLNIEKINNRITSNVVQNVYKGKELKKHLLGINSFVEYMDAILLSQQKEYIVILVTRDTPGDCLSDEEIRLIHSMGFSEFTRNLWNMYVGIKYCDTVIFNYSAKREEENICFNSRIANGINIQIESKSWRHGNICKIMIDGKDHAVNCRGINLVILDATTGEYIDSIGYDHHYKDSKFYRK